MAKVDFVSKQYNEFGGYFSGLGSSLITVSGNTVTVGGKLVFSTAQWNITASWNGTQLFSIAVNYPHSLEVYSSDTLFYLQGVDPQGRRYLLMYEKIGDTVLYGQLNGGAGTGISRYAMTSVTLTDASNSGKTYVHGTVFNYATDVGKIDYAKSSALFNNSIKKLTDTNFMACSTVTQGSVVTIAGENYYAVTTKELLPIDSN
jgi:hypothetical protein